MNLRLLSMEARGGGAAAAAETHRVDLPPTATLADVRCLLASKLSAAQPVPAESVRLSLNRREELVSPDPAAALPSLGLASGNLVFFALSPLTALAPPAQTLPRNPSPGASASVADAVDRGKGSELPITGGSSSSSQAQAVLGDLKREMANVGAAEGTTAGRLVAALHAAMLDVGFITATQMRSQLSLPQDWPSGALKPLTIKYTIPELSSVLPELSSVLSVTEEGKLVVLNYSLMANFVMVYGYVHGAQSELCRLCLELPGLEPLLYLDSDQLSGVHEKGVLDLWRVLKDKICLPLMISLCQLNGFSLPPCLMTLPADLKTKVLEFLPGVDLAKVECTCKEMRKLASDDSIWKKLVSKYEISGEGSRGPSKSIWKLVSMYEIYGEGSRGASKSAKAAFVEFWQANKRWQKRPNLTFWNLLRKPVTGGSSSSSQAEGVVVNPSFPVASDPPDVVMEDAFDATKSWSSFVLRDLIKGEMSNVGGAEETAAGRLVASLHAALLDFGFVTATQMGSHLSLPQGWPLGALKPLIIKYTIPELLAMSSVTEEGKVVVLNFSLMANFVMVYGYVHASQSEVCRLCLELPVLEPLLYLDSDQLSGVHEKGLHFLWRVLKDGICLPLMISLCKLNGFSLPPCLMALPADLKTKVLEFLPGVDLAKVVCTCKEMRNLASDDIIWNKLILKYKCYGEGFGGASMSAKAIFAEFWQDNKRGQKRPNPTFSNYGSGNRPYGSPFFWNPGSVGRVSPWKTTKEHLASVQRRRLGAT